jgi:titin
LTWLAPASNGGSAITDYLIQRSPNGTTGWVTINDGVRSTTGYVVTGLANGTRYYLRVLAHNVAGNSAPSTVANSIPRTVPSAPRTLTAAATNVTGQVRLSWLLPASNGGSTLTDYIIQRSPNGSTGWVTINDGVRTTTNYTVTGLTDGTRYFFRVLARNAAGTGPPSNVVSAVPHGLPSTPRGLRYDNPCAPPARVGQLPCLSGPNATYLNRLHLTWLPPASTGGSTITEYVVQREEPYLSHTWVTVSRTTSTNVWLTVSRSTNFRYYRVLARNGTGIGPPSAELYTATPSSINDHCVAWNPETDWCTGWMPAEAR